MRILIVGAGNVGLAMAAHLSMLDHQITVWNRTASHITELKKALMIKVSGALCGKAGIYKATSNIYEALSGVDFIIVATPVTAHREIAKLFSNYVDKLPPILLSPGRTFGLIEFIDNLNSKNVLIAEAQTVMHASRFVSNSVHIFAIKKEIMFSCKTPDKLKFFLNCMPHGLEKHYYPASNVLETSFSNLGMILHCVPMLLNTGWVESNQKFNYYQDGITPRIAELLCKLDNERILIARSYGVTVKSLTAWLIDTYGSSGSSLYQILQNTAPYHYIDAPQTMDHRYVNEDVSFGLVPMEMLAQIKNIDTPIFSAVIDMASLVMNKDYRLVCAFRSMKPFLTSKGML